MGIATAAMAIGQTAGPLLTGYVSDTFGVVTGMASSTAVLVLASGVTLLQFDRRRISS
ncbi:MFS transporter [Ferrithrix thermotolerans]|uniref:MFS transporter n=1 Tax=Ferrithrix thermotolerans TaxID=209649 RepID=UPI001160D85C|nr:MFS transporter [Ferrithrix thermotolerans]